MDYFVPPNESSQATQVVQHATSGIAPSSLTPSSAEQSALLLRAAQGDREAFNSVYLQTHQALYRFLMLMLSDSHTAADVMQDCYVQLLRNPAGFDPGKSPGTTLTHYVCGIGRYLAWGYMREHQREISLADPQELLESQEHASVTLPGGAVALKNGLEHVLAQEQAYLVQQALHRVPAAFREVLILVELQDYSYEQVAQLMGIQIGTVRSRLSRAKDKLAHELAVCMHERGSTNATNSTTRTKTGAL